MRLSFAKPVFAWSGNFAAWITAGWLAIYLADVRALATPLHFILAPALIAFTFPYARFPRGKTAVLLAIFVICYVVQKAVSPGLSIRALIEVTLLAYCFSLATSSTPGGVRRLTYGVAIFLTVSSAFFLVTVFSSSARELRSQLYFGNEQMADKLEDTLGEEMVDSDHFQQGGLSVFLHSFGYQIAGGLVLCAGMALFGKSRDRFAWVAAVAISVAAMVLAGERSALIATFLSIAAMLVALRRFGYAAVLIVVGAGGALIASTDILEFDEARKYNVISRLQEEEDVASRLDLQLWALSKIPYYPLGLSAMGDTYDAALARDHRTDRFAPHNGYITRTLFFGWAVGVAIFSILFILFRMGRSTVKAQSGDNATSIEVPLLWAAVSIMFNALFHNSSIATFDPPTLTLILLYAKSYDVRAGVRRPTMGATRAQPAVSDSSPPRSVPPEWRAPAAQERDPSKNIGLRAPTLKSIERQ